MNASVKSSRMPVSPRGAGEEETIHTIAVWRQSSKGPHRFTSARYLGRFGRTTTTTSWDVRT